MTKPAIRVVNLSKEYLIGRSHQNSGTLYDLLSRSIMAPLRHLRNVGVYTDHSDRFLALNEISFEIKPGEVMGVIGRNGAGKSTLLKILSRITAPTRGHVEVRGRLASLLEVGTGFHPELSGRENIFLNGAILGMTRIEVTRKYDEIVAFAEIEKFVDMPVKRYSSGMYVRLAFGVAAHLEPDILIIDEVLAVGDAVFQNKCLGKINDVANGGRTVLFVSHNMQAVQSLCSKCLLMSNGRIAALGPPDDVISRYLDLAGNDFSTVWSHDEGIGNAAVRLKKFAIKSLARDVAGAVLSSDSDIVVDMHIELERPLAGLCIGFDLIGRNGITILRSYNTDTHPEKFMPLRLGGNILQCMIPRGLLNAGNYQLAPRIGVHNQEWILNSDPLLSFSVILNHGESPFWNSLDENSRPGAIAPIFSWSNF